jgi:hypothetical protein
MGHYTALIRHGVAAVLLGMFSTAARAQDAAPPPQALLNEPAMVERAVIFVDRRQGNEQFTNGFYPDLWNMIPGAGWISGGPGYRHWYARDSVFVDASAAVSWRGYKTTQARIELPKIARSRLAVGSQFRWQDFTQVSFFGQGADTLPSNRSEYRIRSHNLVGYATLRPVERVGIGAQLGWLRPSILPRGGWFEGDRPDTRDLFGSDPVFAVSDQPGFAHSELSVTADTRDFPRHPTRGGLYRAAASRYSDADDVFSFRRYDVEAAQFVPVAGSRVVFGVHGWLVMSSTGEGHAVPFYLQPSLGGHNTLRSYPDYRFHDRNLLLLNVEGRVAVMPHVDATVFIDAGNVAARVADVNLDKRSYGAGLRLHNRRSTFARLDLARGGEGWRVLLRMSDPLDLSRLVRRTAAAPFVP